MDGIDEQLLARGTKHEDQFTIYFLDETWLNTFPLTLATVPDYFYLSSFYDKTANNEKTREDLSQLKAMKGLEYIFEQPQTEVLIFHVRKQFRHSEKKTTDLALYYVHQGRIYQAPILSAVLQSRIQNLSTMLQVSLKSLANCAAISIDKSESWIR